MVSMTLELLAAPFQLGMVEDGDDNFSDNLPSQFGSCWYFTRKEIENLSPSRTDGINSNKESEALLFIHKRFWDKAWRVPDKPEVASIVQPAVRRDPLPGMGAMWQQVPQKSKGKQVVFSRDSRSDMHQPMHAGASSSGARFPTDQMQIKNSFSILDGPLPSYEPILGMISMPSGASEQRSVMGNGGSDVPRSHEQLIFGECGEVQGEASNSLLEGADTRGVPSGVVGSVGVREAGGEKLALAELSKPGKDSSSVVMGLEEVRGVVGGKLAFGEQLGFRCPSEDLKLAHNSLLNGVGNTPLKQSFLGVGLSVLPEVLHVADSVSAPESPLHIPGSSRLLVMSQQPSPLSEEEVLSVVGAKGKVVSRDYSQYEFKKFGEEPGVVLEGWISE